MRLLEKSMGLASMRPWPAPRKTNDYDWGDLHGVLLVGRPTRMPIIRKMLADKLKQRVRTASSRSRAI